MTSSRLRRTAIVFWLCLVAAVFLLSLVHDFSLRDCLSGILPWLRDSQWAPALFVLAYLVLPLVFFSPTILTIFSGVVFGPFWGVVYTLIGTFLSSTLAYSLGRILGKEFLQRVIQNSRWACWSNKLKREGFKTVLIMRLLFVPFDLVNYLSGALMIPFRAFMSATFLGSILPIVLFVQFGHASGLGYEERPQVNLLLILGVSSLMGLVFFFLRRRAKGQTPNSSPPPKRYNK